MADLLPSNPEIEAPEGEPRVLGVDSDDADDVLAALSSGTARSILATLHEDPATASEVADSVDTSLQNAQYHLEKLTDAALIEVCGTRYSAKGREMRVYAPTDGPLVLFAGDDDEGRDVQRALARLLGAIGILGIASLAVQYVAGGGLSPATAGGDAAPATASGAAGGGPSIAEATRTAVETTVAATQTAAAGSGSPGLLGTLPPGLLFFLGGLLVVALVALGRWYR